MTYQILQGDCLETLKSLPERSVQTCVTSPPYYGLRSYIDDDSEDKVLEIGLEQSPEEYIAKLVEVFREVRRVLKDDGTLWLNLGDSYAGSGKGGQSEEKRSENWQPEYANKGMTYGLKPKDLMMIPARVALALQADGWWLRSEIVWHKPNPMPESVTDRPTKSHEMIYLLAKSAHYFYDAEAIKEPSVIGKTDLETETVGDKHLQGNRFSGSNGHNLGQCNGTRNKRDVWTVTTKPYKEAHFATFPPDLIEPCILAGTSEKGECPDCGKAWVRVVEKEYTPTRPGNNSKYFDENGKDNIRGDNSGHLRTRTELAVTTTGWQPQCECGLDPVSQTVLDPFNGSGTTGAVAIKHGRNYIGCELNPEYIELTHKRLEEVQPVMI